MRYCDQCGCELRDNERTCPQCGASAHGGQNGYNNNYNNAPAEKQESSTIATLALVFSILGGCLGLILSIVGLATLKQPKNRQLCIIGLVLSIIWIVVSIIIYIAMFDQIMQMMGM